MHVEPRLGSGWLPAWCPELASSPPQASPAPEPHGCRYQSIDYQALRYYSAPKFKKQLNSLDEVDPAVLKTFEKLGISLNEQARTPR